MTIIQEMHEKRYQLDEEYVQAGWSLEWDEVGWCTAVCPECHSYEISLPTHSDPAFICAECGYEWGEVDMGFVQ